MILLIDNYDSFTWNLYQQMAGLGAEVLVLRNDALDVAGFLALEAEAVVLGAGPGRPREAGACMELLARLPGSTPLLGVCLGHEALIEHCGGTLEVDPIPVHGRASAVRHDGSALFAGLSSPFEAGRYHSLRARREDLPEELAVSAWTDEGLVMGVRHRALSRFGVQFHPESVLSPEGGRLMANFLALAERATAARSAS
jgi:anthranilate synthase/aminodeoxychorismate synthase-like glutamine amidotransferase